MSADDKTVKRHSAIKPNSNLKRKRERERRAGPIAPYFHSDAESITLPQINVRYVDKFVSRKYSSRYLSIYENRDEKSLREREEARAEERNR